MNSWNKKYPFLPLITLLFFAGCSASIDIPSDVERGSYGEMFAGAEKHRFIYLQLSSQKREYQIDAIHAFLGPPDWDNALTNSEHQWCWTMLGMNKSHSLLITYDSTENRMWAHWITAYTGGFNSEAQDRVSH